MKDEINSQIPFPQKKKTLNVKQVSAIQNVLKTFLKALPPFSNRSLPCTHWGVYKPPDPQLCFIAGLSVLSSLKKLKSTLDATQIHSFRKNANDHKDER